MIYHGVFLHLAWDKNLLSHSSEISQKVLTGRQQGWLLEPHVRQILNVLEKSDSFSLFFVCALPHLLTIFSLKAVVKKI